MFDRCSWLVCGLKTSSLRQGRSSCAHGPMLGGGSSFVGLGIHLNAKCGISTV